MIKELTFSKDDKKTKMTFAEFKEKFLQIYPDYLEWLESRDKMRKKSWLEPLIELRKQFLSEAKDEVDRRIRLHAIGEIAFHYTNGIFPYKKDLLLKNFAEAERILEDEVLREKVKRKIEEEEIEALKREKEEKERIKKAIDEAKRNNWKYEKATYYECNKDFREELEDHYGDDLTSVSEQKKESLRSLGKHYDGLFKSKTFMPIEEFVKANPNFYTFSEKIEYYITGKPTIRERKEIKQVKTMNDKLTIRLKTGLITEKGLAFSFLKSCLNPKKKLNVNYKTWWIGDCIAWAIVEDQGIVIEKEKRQDLMMTERELKEFEADFFKLRRENPQAYEELVPSVLITNREIRELLGKEKLLNSEIHELVRQFVGVTVERKSPIKISRDGDTWVRFGEIDNICRVQYIETGKFSNRGKQPDICYRFIFDKAASIDFWCSLRLGFFDCRPKSYYNELRGASQLILRAIGWTGRPTNLELSQLCSIAGYTTRNKTWRQRYIENCLDELKEKGFIRDWEKRIKKAKKGKQKEIWYKIYKAKKLPEK